MMSTGTIASMRTTDRFAHLWLGAAAAFFLCATGRWAVPLAAWLAPVFLLRFVRVQRPLRGLLMAGLVRFAVAALVLRGIVAISGIRYYASVLLLVVVAIMPYVADRLVAPRLSGLVATLVFPLAFTTVEYLGSFAPSGTSYSIAYTQYGDLPLMQLVSVTGIWGLTFLITWFASVVNWAWERGPVRRGARAGALLYVCVLSAVLVGGGLRLVFQRPPMTPVRVAGLSASREAVAAFDRQLMPRTLARLETGTATQAERHQAHLAFAALTNDLLERSRKEARAGAKIVVWPEGSPVGANVVDEDRPALLRQAAAVARQEGIYLDLGVAVFLPGTGTAPYLEDEAVLLDPSGRVVWTYEKTHLVPFTEQGFTVPGNGRVPMVDSPYGRLANVICFDLDYPRMMRQAGQAGAALVLAPSDDWQAIDPAHAQTATFRAIENGFSLVRQASQGLSIAVDHEGRVLAASDYFTTDPQVMVAYLPTRGVRTVYAAVGDVFAWLCLTGLVTLVGLATLHPRAGTRGGPAHSAGGVG
jgi:apolipoprotein N-acyltransferase